MIFFIIMLGTHLSYEVDMGLVESTTPALATTVSVDIMMKTKRKKAKRSKQSRE
jgi:hypothetical protein